MRREMAVGYGCTGPVLRGSGVDFDLRRDGEPIYTRMYQGYDFEDIQSPRSRMPATSDEVVLGDNWCRFYRPHAGSGASDQARAAGDGPVPDDAGTFRVPFKMSTKLPSRRSAISKPNAPAGRWASTSSATAKPNRCGPGPRARCFCNLSVTGALCRGVLHRRHPRDRRRRWTS